MHLERGRIAVLTLVFLILLSCGIKLYYVDKYPVYEDEAMSILGAEGIIQHGVPMIPSGFIYSGEYLHQYLLALPMVLFGTNELTTRIKSIIFSLLTILGVYLLVSRYAGPWGGILAGGVLVFSRIEVSYALSARMYAQYQTFTVFSAYLFLMGFVENSKKYKVLCLIAVLGMFFSHQLALLSLGVMGLYLFFQERLNLLRDRFVWISLAILIPVLYFIYLYQVPNAMPTISGHSWRMKPLYAITEFNYETLTFYWRHLFSGYFPWSLPVFLAGLVWTIWKRDRELIFLYLLVAVPTLIMTLFDYKSPHYLSNVFAVYVGVVCIVLVNFWKAIRDSLQEYLFKDGPPTNIPKIMAGILGITLLVIYVFMAATHWKRAYGFEPRRANEEPAHRFIQVRLQPGDVIITSNPWMTYYYLKKFDFFIRQKMYEDKGWDAFPFERDEYYGKPIVDTLPELQDIMSNPSYKRVWLVADEKFRRATGRQMISYVAENFRPVYGDYRGSAAIVAVYENSAGGKP